MPPITAAAKKKRRKPEPLAFLTVAIRSVSNFASNGDRGFIWSYDAQLRHPASGFTRDLSGTTTITALTASTEQTRAQITGGARSIARTFLGQAGHDVPEDRIAVVVL